jgi:hypothetical protein
MKCVEYFIWRTLKKIPLGKPIRKKGDNIKIDLKDTRFTNAKSDVTTLQVD